MATLRQARVGEMIRRDLAEILQKEMRDPRLAMVTITGVDVARDFTIAKVYVSVLGDAQDRSLAMRALRGAAGFLRGHLGRMLEIRSVPELKFLYDQGIQRGIEMFEILKTEEAALSGAVTAITPGTYKEEKVRGVNERAVRVDQVDFDADEDADVDAEEVDSDDDVIVDEDPNAE
jgi:ribosome-binding factor A